MQGQVLISHTSCLHAAVLNYCNKSLTCRIFGTTARVLEDFIINENYVCRLFARNAQCSLEKIFSMYSDDIVSTCNLRIIISDMFFGRHYRICSLYE